MTYEEALEGIMEEIKEIPFPAEYSKLSEKWKKIIDACCEDSPKSCFYYTENNKKPYCTHECNGCVWYK